MKNVLEFFEQTVSKYPQKIGFIDSKSEKTFGEVSVNAKKIGSFLLQYGTRKPVVLLIDKNIGCIESMLGSLYSNDFYIVVDVHSPISRIETIISVLDDPIVIADFENTELAKSVSDNYYVYEEILNSEENEKALKEARGEMCDVDTAYILFTSGSTGTPKGTVISHRALISYINWVTEEFGFDEKTVFGSQTPLYFSMSVTDFYSTVKCGCTYDIIPRQNFSFPINLVQYLNSHSINTIYWVPTAISILANWKVFDVLKPQYLQKVLFAGEVMPTRQLNYWIHNLDENIQYANLFGPTETTDICTYYVIDRSFGDEEILPIGKHCDNCDVFIVDESGKKVNGTGEGELYVRSSFLADGYYKNLQKTSEVFVQNPLNLCYPETVYKTGDIVRYNERGELLYITRADFQIKRMGYRIELGEIEASANGVDKVKSCACVYDSEKDLLVLIYEGPQKYLEKVTETVKNKVPPYMMPDRVKCIREMPLNANGKIDRKALIKIYSTL